MSFVPRKWQEECLIRFKKKMSGTEHRFMLEACMGSGKSAMAAMMAKALLASKEDGGFDVDHILVLVPWRSIQGDTDKGMMGTFAIMGLDVRDRFFAIKKRMPRQPKPDEIDATITLYQEVWCQATIDTISMWQRDGGFSFGLICDEIHHANEIDSSWGDFVGQLRRMASYSIFMSGTPFRADGKGIEGMELGPDGKPIRDYWFEYADGVRERVVRPVTTRELNPRVTLLNKSDGVRYEKKLSDLEGEEVVEAKKQVLDPHGECIRWIIEKVHLDLIRTRNRFKDAACLYVCRPGGGGDFTEEGMDSQEDKHVHLIARQIELLTGETPTVVTHRDRDAIGKIARFRRGTDPYLVAVNMVSEGCDIPRLRAVAFCRYTESDMLFRQVVGRALRQTSDEDGTAAQVYIPAFKNLIDFAKTLEGESKQGVRDGSCKICGEWTCVCPCKKCGKPRPCDCGPTLFSEPRTPNKLVLGLEPEFDGGHIGLEHMIEPHLAEIAKLASKVPALLHCNETQMAKIFAVGYALGGLSQEAARTPESAERFNPTAEREKLGRQIKRRVKHLAIEVYGRDFSKAFREEVEKPFGESFTTISRARPLEKLREVSDRLERRIMEIFTRG